MRQTYCKTRSIADGAQFAAPVLGPFIIVFRLSRHVEFISLLVIIFIFNHIVESCLKPSVVLLPDRLLQSRGFAEQLHFLRFIKPHNLLQFSVD